MSYKRNKLSKYLSALYYEAYSCYIGYSNTMSYQYGKRIRKSSSSEYESSISLTLDFRRRVQAQFFSSVKKFVFGTILAVAAISSIVIEIILLTRDVAPPAIDDYGMPEDVNYGETLTIEDEYKQIFNLIDSIPDGLLTLQEFEAYALFRFREHTPNSELDEYGIAKPPKYAVENTIIEDAFLNGFDLNGDNILKDDELTDENVKTLFDKAKEVMDSYDKDKNRLVTWEEFSLLLK